MKLQLSIVKYQQRNTYHIVLGDVETKQFYVSYYANILDYNDKDLLMFISDKQGHKRYVGCIDNYIIMNSRIDIRGTNDFIELFYIDQRMKENKELYGKN